MGRIERYHKLLNKKINKTNGEGCASYAPAGTPAEFVVNPCHNCRKNSSYGKHGCPVNNRDSAL